MNPTHHPTPDTAADGVSSVKPTLTPRPRKTVENPQYAAFARRIIRAHARRITDGDIEALTDLVGLSLEVDTAITLAVKGLRSYGYSWGDIAARLGITRQAAQQRWGGQR